MNKYLKEFLNSLKNDYFKSKKEFKLFKELLTHKDFNNYIENWLLGETLNTMDVLSDIIDILGYKNTEEGKCYLCKEWIVNNKLIKLSFNTEFDWTEDVELKWGLCFKKTAFYDIEVKIWRGKIRKAVK